MSKYVIKRVLIMIPTLLAIIFIVFGIMNLTPTNPARIILGTQASQEAVDQLNHEMGMDDPFIVRYVNYVGDLLHGDMGDSYQSGRPVVDEILQRFPTTVSLAVLAIFVAILIGIPLGILAAVKQYSIFDVIGTSVAMFMASMPGFWLGLMAIILFALHLGWLPSAGIETWQGYILPVLTLAIPVSASFMRLTRTTMLETVRQDYVRTARAKGQTEGKIISRHALKNALLPVVTVAGMEFGNQLGGIVTIETVFSIDGIGSLILTAIRMKDIPLVAACALTLAFCYMVIMLFVDILYAYIDPRVKALYKKA